VSINYVDGSQRDNHYSTPPGSSNSVGEWVYTVVCQSINQCILLICQVLLCSAVTGLWRGVHHISAACCWNICTKVKIFQELIRTLPLSLWLSCVYLSVSLSVPISVWHFRCPLCGAQGTWVFSILTLGPSHEPPPIMLLGLIHNCLFSTLCVPECVLLFQKTK